MTLVMAFGAFDGIHLGHIHYLREARALGDELVVAIARDESSWKTPRGHQLPEKERKRLLEYLKLADRVVLGSHDDALERIRKHKPNIVALTELHNLNPEVLRSELKEAGLETEVRMLPLYKPEVYGRAQKL